MRLSFFLAGVAAIALVGCVRTAPAPPSSGADEIPALPADEPITPTAQPGPPSPVDCSGPGGMQQAASDNAYSLTTLEWTPLGSPERGWEVYVPLIGYEIATACPPQSPAFAEALAHWQKLRRMTADGRMSPQVFAAMYQGWHARRPFAHVDPMNCPAPPSDAELATAAATESYGKPARLKPGALDALRRMTAAAKAVDPQIASDRRNLQIFSGYREPLADMTRCFTSGTCDNRRRTWCSAHRTGTAVDLFVGQAPGYGPDSTAYESRLYLSRTPTYRWLVANAWRFGFVNYAYEPWHWEWTGDPALPAGR